MARYREACGCAWSFPFPAVGGALVFLIGGVPHKIRILRLIGYGAAIAFTQS
jgi:hypothetical protein